MDSNMYVGIDPGVTGAVAWAFWSNDGILEVFAERRKNFTIMDCMAQLENLAAMTGHPSKVFVLIEQVGAMSEGRQACFKLGQSYGEWQTACLATGVGFTLMTPLKWQSLVGLPKKKRTYSERKRALRGLCQQLLPHCRDNINADTQDAMLIAYASQLCFREGAADG